MGIWFKKSDNQKWHLACYGGGVAQCGRMVGIAACYTKLTKDITVDEVRGNANYCQACVNSVMRFREYTKEAEAKYQKEHHRSPGYGVREDILKCAGIPGK